MITRPLSRRDGFVSPAAYPGYIARGCAQPKPIAQGPTATGRSRSAPGETVEDRPIPTRPGFDPALAGKRAECDGGGPVAGTHFASRQEFAGTLTGEYIDHGDPPWRWYLMIDLYRKPEGYPGEAVWCESGSLFLLDASNPD